jgi:hypothetical protein
MRQGSKLHSGATPGPHPGDRGEASAGPPLPPRSERGEGRERGDAGISAAAPGSARTLGGGSPPSRGIVAHTPSPLGAADCGLEGGSWLDRPASGGSCVTPLPTLSPLFASLGGRGGGPRTSAIGSEAEAGARVRSRIRRGRRQRTSRMSVMGGELTLVSGLTGLRRLAQGLRRLRRHAVEADCAASRARCGKTRRFGHRIRNQLQAGQTRTLAWVVDRRAWRVIERVAKGAVAWWDAARQLQPD